MHFSEGYGVQEGPGLNPKEFRIENNDHGEELL
jgi:hypothetical protein